MRTPLFPTLHLALNVAVIALSNAATSAADAFVSPNSLSLAHARSPALKDTWTLRLTEN